MERQPSPAPARDDNAPPASPPGARSGADRPLPFRSKHDMPPVREITSLIESAIAEIPERRVWVNPDCGLKTSAYTETVTSLANIVEATRLVRERSQVSV